MLQYNAYGAAPANTRFLAVCSPFNLNNYKEISLLYMHQSTNKI